MDVDQSTAPAKRPRAKTAIAATKASKPKRKTLTASRKRAVEVEAPILAAPVDLNSMIATTAFYLAADRGFAPGHELDDWLEAERRVRASIAL